MLRLLMLFHLFVICVEKVFSCLSWASPQSCLMFSVQQVDALRWLYRQEWMDQTNLFKHTFLQRLIDWILSKERQIRNKRRDRDCSCVYRSRQQMLIDFKNDCSECGPFLYTVLNCILTDRIYFVLEIIRFRLLICRNYPFRCWVPA